MEQILNRALWTARSALEPFGLPGLCGLLLLVLAVAIVTMGAWPIRGEVHRLATETVQLRTEVASARPLTRAAERPADQLERFYALLPRTTQVSRILGLVENIAASNGVSLVQGEMKLVAEEGNPIARYQMTFPIKGEYSQIREFVRQVLRQAPSVGVDEMSFRRDDPTSAIVEARLQMTLYLLLQN